MISILKTKYRRPLTVFCILLITFLHALAGENEKISCKRIKVINTGINSIDKDLRYFVSPPLIYYYSNDEWNKESRELKINLVNSETNRRDSFVIVLPEIITINYLPEIAIGINYLLLTDDNRQDVFRFEKTGNGFIFKNKIQLPPNSTAGQAMVMKKDKFLLQSIYNYHPAEKVQNTNLGIYDAEKDKFVNFIHPDLPCIAFSHYPNCWTASSDNLIALAYPCGYKIILYDYNLKPVDTINYRPSDWKDLKENKLPCETDPSKINPKLLIDKLKYIGDTINRIEEIRFINNKTLMVVSTLNMDENNRRIDFFDINHLPAPEHACEKVRINYAASDSIEMNQLPLPHSNPSHDVLYNGLFYSISNDDFPEFKNMSFKEYNHEKDLYYEKHDPQFTIQIYKIDIH